MSLLCNSCSCHLPPRQMATVFVFSWYILALSAALLCLCCLVTSPACYLLFVSFTLSRHLYSFLTGASFTQWGREGRCPFVPHLTFRPVCIFKGLISPSHTKCHCRCRCWHCLFNVFLQRVSLHSFPSSSLSLPLCLSPGTLSLANLANWFTWTEWKECRVIWSIHLSPVSLPV